MEPFLTLAVLTLSTVPCTGTDRKIRTFHKRGRMPLALRISPVSAVLWGDTPEPRERRKRSASY